MLLEALTPFLPQKMPTTSKTYNAVLLHFVEGYSPTEAANEVGIIHQGVIRATTPIANRLIEAGYYVDYVLPEGLVAVLNPMATAPKDRTEILAWSPVGNNFHPILWTNYHGQKKLDPDEGYWCCRWKPGYRQWSSYYTGWIPYPEYKPFN